MTAEAVEGTSDSGQGSSSSGADEFAFRKGCTYGTELVDTEAGQVADGLPDCASETLAA